MKKYKNIVNPYTTKLQKVLDDTYIVSLVSSITFKEGVATVGNLPIDGNTKNDIRIVNDTHNLYIWNSMGWVNQGDIIDVDWSALTGKPSSSAADIDDAVTKTHAKSHDHIEEDITDLKHDAQKIKGKEVDNTDIADGKILNFNSTSDKLEYVDPPEGGGGSEFWS